MKKQRNGFLLFTLILSIIILIASCGDSTHNKTVSDSDVGPYPNAGLLVSGDSLEASIGKKNTVIIDARSSGYSTSHIPGAISLLWDDYTDEGVNLKPVGDLESQLSAAGLSKDMKFIIYDDTTASWGAAGRIFWMLEYLGCTDVHILNGGWDKWVEDGRSAEAKINTLPEGTFVADLKEDSLAHKDHILSRLGDEDFVIIDSREDEEYNGWTLYGEPRGGHIRGAVTVNYKWFFNSDKTVLSYEVLKDLLESREITTDKEVVSYCTAGIRSGFVYFALRLMGYDQCSNYDGSIYDWSADASAPMDAMPNYHKLVYPGWVEGLIANGNPGTAGVPSTYPGNGYVILECRYDCSEEAGHIPRAISVHPCYFENEFNTSLYYPNYNDPGDGNLLPDVELQAAIETLGITKDTTVVVYGNGRIIPMTSGRVAWALMYAGVEDVRILNGGYTAWLENGGEEEFTTNDFLPVEDFGAIVPVHPEYHSTTEYVSDTVEGRNTESVLADVRSLDEYLGIAVNQYPFFDTTGHIPGAIWIDNWVEMVDMSDDTFRSYTEVKKFWYELNITPDKEPVFYCGTGWRSGMGFFYAYLMGYPAMRNYDGGLYEWTWNPNNSIAKGYYGDFTTSISMQELFNAIEREDTAPDNENRLLVVDVRSSESFIEGHIKDSLSVPLYMVVSGSDPLYTNGYDLISPIASSNLTNSWLAHMLINQLVNDFTTTYDDSHIVFYGNTEKACRTAAHAASKIGYKNVSYLEGAFETWCATYSDLTEQYYPGVDSVDLADRSFVMTGFINNTNFENVSTRATHHCIVYKGGGLHNYGLFQADISPFCFQELLVYLGASPDGNMADGVYFGDIDEWGSKYTDGEPVEYTVTWEGADRFFSLDEIYEELPSEFQPDVSLFTPMGIEPRIGGTRESNVNWNPGCIFCFYSCVCGITSNARANENTWFYDGGIYDTLNPNVA